MPAPIAADFSDRADFANSDRGFIGTMEPMVITAADGRVVWEMELSNGALIHYPTPGSHAADLTVTLTKPQLLQLLATGKPGGIGTSGDSAVLGRLMSLIDNPDPDFAIVTP